VVLARAPRAAIPIALVCVLYVVAVGTSAGREAESDFLINPVPAADSLWAALIATVPWTVAIGAALATVVAARNDGANGAIAVVIVVAGANLTAYGLEHALAALDPLGGERERVLGEGFFPSGHATAAMSLFPALLLAFPGRASLAAGAFAYGAAVAVALVVAPGHHISDVLAGVLIVGAWAVVVGVRASAGPPRPSLPVAAACGALGGVTVAVICGVAPHEHLDLVLASALVIWTASAVAVLVSSSP
jgi:membrane-associated phospholipid phosphatase